MIIFTLTANSKSIVLSPIDIDTFSSSGRLIQLTPSFKRTDKQYALSDGKTVLYGKRLSKATLKISIECNFDNLEYIKSVLNRSFTYSVSYTDTYKTFNYEMFLSGNVTEEKIYNANSKLYKLSFTLEEM